jgi:hypothetical protein
MTFAARSCRAAAILMAVAIGSVVEARAETSGKFGDTTVSVGGYIKLDVIYSIDQDTGDTQDPSALVIGGTTGDGDFRLHARQSRLWLKTARPTDLGDVRTHLEGDFFGAGGNEVFSNSRTLRLRHAYATAGGLLAGQTWTNFMQFTAYPDTVDFNGPMGSSFIRQAQLRYGQSSGGNAEWSVSLENPEATGFATVKDRFPDLTARWKWQAGPFGVELSGVARSLEYETATASDTATGYGVMASARYRAGSLTLMGNLIGGDGIGRYLYPSASSGGTGIGEAFVDGSGRLQTVRARGGQLAVVQRWTPGLSSGLSYGITAGDRPGPLSTDKLESAHFTNLWTPVKDVVFGAELSWQRKTLTDGQSADAKRLQFSTQVGFRAPPRPCFARPAPAGGKLIGRAGSTRACRRAAAESAMSRLAAAIGE